MDGDENSRWGSPPNDPEQTIVFSLAAPARVEKLGVLIPPAPPTTIRSLTLATSEDGISFTPVEGVEVKASSEMQWFPAAVPSARYVRVEITEGGHQLASLQSIHLSGEWLSPPTVAPIEDCWAVNEMAGSFADREGRIGGWLDTSPEKTQIDGGRHGSVYRFAWARGPQWGHALVTLTPDGKRLSGMKWHELTGGHSVGGTWFGERRSCSASGMNPDLVVETFLRQAGWYPLYSLHFDDSDALVVQSSAAGLRLIEYIVRSGSSQRIRLAAREYHEETPEANRRRAEKRLGTLRDALAKRGVDLTRIDFAPLGVDEPRIAVTNEAMRLMYGAVEIQIPGAGQTAF
ncbi:MAG: discoidin domain-containing protein [Thermoanaerobaculia bacterium]